ncbi:hypothetical protein GGR51DRAFT_555654 [Nemania sp. FL0031]|nr:hypothetical protein GGR51DRAFT_555654 [Nemania sp. FL0031]
MKLHPRLFLLSRIILRGTRGKRPVLSLTRCRWVCRNCARLANDIARTQDADLADSQPGLHFQASSGSAIRRVDLLCHVALIIRNQGVWAKVAG